MDIMKTLLIYLSATMAFAVQSTSAPKETPTPSPEPVAIVETLAPDTEETGNVVESTAAPAETSAAAATQKPTPVPVPTITPNMKGYRNLAMGAKGKEVIKLQEKLIEMKYLPEGAADGAYGRQTYNAVKRFQYYNGLKQDGVAGRATQTNLFENPEIVPYPGTETASPAVTDTPAPTPTPTPEPTEAPTEAPTEVPSEEPEETAAEAPGGEDGTLPKWAADLEPEATEEPTPVPATPTPTPIPILTTAPETITTDESTDAPEVTPEPEEELPEIVENVDLDADVYEPIVGIVALNEGSGPLEFIAMEDGVPVTAHPRLRQNGAKIQVSLDDLCRCEESWTLTDDGLGTVVLEAAGYTLAVYNEDRGISASVDGNEIAVRQDDMDFSADGHFINAEFLASALKGEAEWIPEENTLMLRIRDREAVEAAD